MYLLFLKLYERTKALIWKKLADDIVSNLLYLQCSNGGFKFAANESEPAYNSEMTRPIAQGMPVIALIQYSVWEHAGSVLRQLSHQAVDKHWGWFHSFFWLQGSAYQKFPMKNPGWCGVTNQDLVIVAAIALYAKPYGDSKRFDEFGKACP